ncbi:oxygenase MpaB family protein [Baekduia sp. Peel2402]|uniref:oxygenase MpaB family protein n=1 Tax=Baekduia sp. Peel2402 TaxID=3458296 RepID=UPI00403E4D7D
MSTLPDRAEWPELAPQMGSPVWNAFCDYRMLATAGYALLLQVSHPTVGAGVHQHSAFVSDPWGRLLRTLDYVHGTVYGGPELAGTIGARVRGMHKGIRGVRDDGERYSAMEPDAFAWVHATLALGIVEGCRRFATPMSAEQREAFYAQWLQVGRLIGVRSRDLPDDWAGFEAYAQQTIERDLAWTPAVPQVLDTLRYAARPAVPGLRPGVWRALRVPMSAQLQLTTVGMLPPVLRERLGQTWSAQQRAAFAALCMGLKASGPLRVGPLREFGPHYVRWRRRALERGDVAGAGTAAAVARTVAA